MYHFSLIICTYKRPQSILKLLQSVKKQTIYPNEILIVDGSIDNCTKDILQQNHYDNVVYFKVDAHSRGLTKQRNFGISKLHISSEIVCFLDDDTILRSNYFEQILTTFKNFQDAAGVGGIAFNENNWQLNTHNIKTSARYFVLDGYYLKESLRNYLRNILRLNSDQLPNVMPEYSHGRTFSYPMNNKVYAVDLLVGMSMSFKVEVVRNIKFSEYFEGYGLYEDADFSIRALRFGQNYIATAAQLGHYHDQLGRPNNYKYGKMVIRNGFYVWRTKYPKPTVGSKIKWLQINILLIIIRFINIVSTKKRMASLAETAGRVSGLLSLLINRPKIDQ